MLNKILLIVVVSLLVVGCKCNKSGGSVESTVVLYDVRCYENGTLIVDTTTTTAPTVNDNNTYWRDDNTGALIDLSASCTVFPRNSNEPKRSTTNSGQISNRR